MPQCVTCEGYISIDFVRVFGDNDRVVRTCPSCHGNQPDASAESAVTVQTDGGKETDRASEGTAGIDGGDGDDGDDEGERMDRRGASTAGKPNDGRSRLGTGDRTSESSLDEYDDGPTQAGTTATGQSRMGFIRSVLFR